MIKLYDLDLLPFFEPDQNQIIRNVCEVKQKSLDLIDTLLDYEDQRLTQTLTEILGFLADVSKAIADMAADKGFSIHYFACCTSRFREWYMKLDDLTRHWTPHKIIKETGFEFRSLHFSCRALDEILSSWFSEWFSLHPEASSLDFPRDWSKVCFAPLPPNLDIDFDASHYIV